MYNSDMKNEDMARFHAGQLTASFMVKTGVRQGLSATTPVAAHHKLVHEKDYRKQKKWDPLDTLEPVGGTGLCG